MLIVNNVGNVYCGGILFFLILMLIKVLIIWLIIVFGLSNGDKNGNE